MTKANTSTVTKAKHKKILKLAKGYVGRSKNCYRIAIEKVEKGLSYAYRDRRNKKRDFRGLWIQRINSAVREHGMVYSNFMGLLIKANIDIDRKTLSDLAMSDKSAFADIISRVKAS